MADDFTGVRDAMWKLYQEHTTHMRHYETQRSAVASALIAVAAILLGVITFDKTVGKSDLPLTLFLVGLGAFGMLFSAKQHERAAMNGSRARHFRNAIDSTLGNQLKAVKDLADAAHADEFPQGWRWKFVPRLREVKVNKLWLGLHALVALLGAVLTYVAIARPLSAP